MTKVTIKNNKLIKDPIGIGQYYKSGDIIYILASVDDKKVILVSTNGKRWPVQPVEVSNIDNISNEEWDKIRYGNELELIPEITIIL